MYPRLDLNTLILLPLVLWHILLACTITTVVMLNNYSSQRASFIIAFPSRHFDFFEIASFILG